MSKPTLQWDQNGQVHTALWCSERGSKPPSRVVIADDQLPADQAYKLACEGVGLLWQGDYHNARQTMQAMARRVDKASKKKMSKKEGPASPALAFHQHRQARAQRANVLSKVLVRVEPDYQIKLRRAPDVRAMLTAFWDEAVDEPPRVLPLKDLQGLIGAFEWSKKGVEIPALGQAPNNRIFPDYGVYSPVRGEYIELVAQAELPSGNPASLTAFDIGTGTGVLAALLAKRGVSRVVATDNSPRALVCAQKNLDQLGYSAQVELHPCDLFPEGQADLVVCNPPWLPAKAGSAIEQAVYDPDSKMLIGFLKGLSAHLKPEGEGWLILSDLAEHLGLRSASEVLECIAANGLKVLDTHKTRPNHPKVQDASDPLHAARAQETTVLWRLGHA